MKISQLNNFGTISKNQIISMFAFGVIGVSVLTAVVLTEIPYFQKERATTSLNLYLDTLGLNSIKSICNKDSDGDGYSSCSYNNGKEVIALECDSALIFNSGSCKKPKSMFH